MYLHPTQMLLDSGGHFFLLPISYGKHKTRLALNETRKSIHLFEDSLDDTLCLPSEVRLAAGRSRQGPQIMESTLEKRGQGLSGLPIRPRSVVQSLIQPRLELSGINLGAPQKFFGFSGTNLRRLTEQTERELVEPLVLLLRAEFLHFLLPSCSPWRGCIQRGAFAAVSCGSGTLGLKCPKLLQSPAVLKDRDREQPSPLLRALAHTPTQPVRVRDTDLLRAKYRS